MKRKSMRQEKIESVIALLMHANSQKNAIDFRDLCLFAMVSEPEAYAAIRQLEGMGFRVRLTDTLPRKFYTIHG